MIINVKFELIVDEEAFKECDPNWGCNRITAALEETVRAVVGLTVPFVETGAPISVGDFTFSEK